MITLNLPGLIQHLVGDMPGEGTVHTVLNLALGKPTTAKFVFTATFVSSRSKNLSPIIA
jgi:hypothetical protein